MNMTESLTSELWLKIDQLHLKYLQSEDTPAKLDIRKKLEGLVAEYLAIVPQQRKFVNPITGDIVANSAKWKPDFSLIKAANAFRAIEQYAANLINQPWRQEFWSIRQYSGFYKHSVETALFGAEKMFLDMGYCPGSQAQVLSLPPARPGQHPVNTDLVTSVARDCVLACVECGLLAEVHSALSVQFPTSLEEVVEFRRDHIGSAEVCVRELLYRKNQLRYQQFPVSPSPQYCSTAVSPSTQYGLQAFPGPHHHPGALPSNGFPSPAFHPAPVYGFPAEYSPSTVFPAGPGPQYVAVERLSQNSQHSHHSPAGSSTSTLRQGQIPTTILELSGQDNHHQPQHHHQSHQQPQQQSQSQQQPQAPERRSRGEKEGGARPREQREARSGKSRKSGAEQDFDSWDYVYKHLQQTGYNKDQAERPDVLERPSSRSEEELRKNIQAMRLRDSARNGHHSGGRPTEQQSHRQSRVLVETSGSDVEQDNSRYSSAVSEETAGHHQSQPQRQHRGDQRQHRSDQSQPQRQHRGEQSQSQRRAELWECSTCTFHNKQNTNICEMCSKSRDFQPSQEARSVEPASSLRRSSPAAAPVEMSAAEEGNACDKCTLVNPVNNTVCEACGATLPKPKLFWESFQAIQTQSFVPPNVRKRTSSKGKNEEYPPLKERSRSTNSGF